MIEIKLSEDGKHLIDSNGIKFKRQKPLATIEIKVSTANPSDTRIDTKLDFVNAIERYPDTNAYLNLGRIPGKIKTEKFKHEDFGDVIIFYGFYKIELYHLGG